MSGETEKRPKKSKASMTVDIQTEGRAVGQGLIVIHDLAKSLFESEAPTKRQRKSLVRAAESRIQLQSSVVEQTHRFPRIERRLLFFLLFIRRTPRRRHNLPKRRHPDLRTKPAVQRSIVP